MDRINEIFIKATELSQIENFEKEVNYRPYELEITSIASSYKIDHELKKELINKIQENKENKKLSFTLFFILFTMCRRQNFDNIYDLVCDYEEYYIEYPIVKHIRTMAALTNCNNKQALYREIKKANKIVKSKSDNHDFTTNTGVLNTYCSLICKYFENELDEKDDSDNIEFIKDAYDSINKAINIEESATGTYAYNKFYLNRGRTLILLKSYAKGEEDIQKAIELLPPSVDRESKVIEYNHYLVKSSIIRAYDLNEEKVKDLDKIKVSNYKSIALMTTLLGFLLGAINIFTNVSDAFTLAMLMLCYCGLMFILLGTILFGFSLNFKERKKSLIIFDIIVILIGIIIFSITLFIIINKKG